MQNPSPGGIVDVGHLKRQPHVPQHVGNPAGLGADLEQHDIILRIQLCKDIVKKLRGSLQGEVRRFQGLAVEFAEHAVAFAKVN